MDRRLVGWARAVKARRRGLPGLPPLWLFTDEARMADVVATVRTLPRGLCGVVFRHDGAEGRARLARQVWAVCRQRRLAMVVAGGAGGPAGAGVHWREGRRTRSGRGHGPATASAHGSAGLVRARRAGAEAVFLSPTFATASHPGQPGLGVVRWCGMARGTRTFALGGIDGASARRLPRWVRGVGAIGALVD